MEGQTGGRGFTPRQYFPGQIRTFSQKVTEETENEPPASRFEATQPAYSIVIGYSSPVLTPSSPLPLGESKDDMGWAVWRFAPSLPTP